MESPIRVGLVGAGSNTRAKHIPGLRAVPGVQIVGVVNRTQTSTQRVAEEFGIPKTYADWRSLVADPEIDAVVVGTWPNLHCEVTCAALEAGKHVLTEARMARNVAEARRMLQTVRAHPHLVAQIVPSPFGLEEHEYVVNLIRDGFLGEMRELVVVGADGVFADPQAPLHWRQDREKSGYNVLALGILHETALRWTPPPVRVLAQTTTFITQRRSPESGQLVPVTVPDSVQVITRLANGGCGLYQLSGVVHGGPGKSITLYGSDGTIRLQIDPVRRLLTGRAGESALSPVEIPPAKRGGWRCEAEFIGAIRGEESVRFTDFETGVKYMEFTEAVARSAACGAAVDLPLDGSR